MGTSTIGMPPLQTAYLQAAKNSGVILDGLTLMTMNMGGRDNVLDAQTAVAGGAVQLAGMYGINVVAATKKMGILPAIGADDNSVVISLKNASTREQNRCYYRPI
jgi:hypothetical protein